MSVFSTRNAGQQKQLPKCRVIIFYPGLCCGERGCAGQPFNVVIKLLLSNIQYCTHSQARPGGGRGRESLNVSRKSSPYFRPNFCVKYLLWCGLRKWLGAQYTCCYTDSIFFFLESWYWVKWGIVMVLSPCPPDLQTRISGIKTLICHQSL